MSTSPILGLPFIAESQSQPNITHNEAILALQVLMTGVLDRFGDTPAVGPSDGDAYIVGSAPTGAWAGRANCIAYYLGGWRFIPGDDSAGTPITMGADQEGLTVYVQDEDTTYRWTGAAWVAGPALPDNSIALAKLVNATLQYNLIGRKTSGAGAWEECTRAELLLAATDTANTFTANQTMQRASGTATTLNVIAEGAGAIFQNTRYSSDSNAPVFQSRKAQGTVASPTIVTNGNVCQSNTAQAYNGSSFVNIGVFSCRVSETTPTSTAIGAQWLLTANPAGSVTASELWRIDHQSGLQMFGTNVVIDQNRIIRPRSYTIGTLPTVTTTGIIHCSDLGGGGALLFSDGTGWCRVKPTGTENITTETSLTFNYARLTNAPVQRANVALTATRTATLLTTGCRNGDRARFVRSSTATGASNWDIVGAETISLTAAKQWVEFEYDGTQWNAIAGGTIP